VLALVFLFPVGTLSLFLFGRNDGSASSTSQSGLSLFLALFVESFLDRLLTDRLLLALTGTKFGPPSPRAISTAAAFLLARDWVHDLLGNSFGAALGPTD